MHVGISTGMIQRGKSGVGQYVFALVRAFLERPDHPGLTLFVLEEDASLFDFAKGRAQIHLVPERFRSPVKNILWHQTALPKLAHRSGLDVLHVPSYRRMIWTRACALVATVHDLAPFRLPGKYDLARMAYGRFVVRALSHRQDAIIAVSQSTASDLERYFRLPSNRIHVIWNGLDHERFCPSDGASSQRTVAEKWGLGAPFFLYVSRLEHPAKNHVRLIEAFSRFKQQTRSPWQLVFGGSRWHGADVILRAIESAPVRDGIRLLGFVPDADLPALYRAAGAMVYPSLFEGFGFPPIEAMACGCPVLSSSRGALGEVVGEAAGLIDPENIEQMQAALTRVASDQAWREQLRQAGFRNARRFDWGRNAEQVLACYTQAAARPRRV